MQVSFASYARERPPAREDVRPFYNDNPAHVLINGMLQGHYMKKKKGRRLASWRLGSPHTGCHGSIASFQKQMFMRHSFYLYKSQLLKKLCSLRPSANSASFNHAWRSATQATSVSHACERTPARGYVRSFYNDDQADVQINGMLQWHYIKRRRGRLRALPVVQLEVDALFELSDCPDHVVLGELGAVFGEGVQHGLTNDQPQV